MVAIIVLHVAANAELRGDLSGFRLTPLATPGMPSVKLFTDAEELADQALLHYGDAIYTIDGVRLGLFDAKHTTSDGRQISKIGGYGGLHDSGLRPAFDFNYRNASGQLIGMSLRRRFWQERLNAPWLYDAASKVTTPLGYVNAQHNDPGSIYFSNVLAINSRGEVTGTSSYGDSQAAWLYRADTKDYRTLGLRQERVTDENSLRVANHPLTLDDAGNVAGVTYAEVPWTQINLVTRTAWYQAAEEAEARRIGPAEPVSIFVGSFVDGRTSQGHILGATEHLDTNERSIFVYDPDKDRSTFITAADDDQAWSGGLTRVFWTTTTPFQTRNHGPMPYAIGAFWRSENNLIGRTAFTYDLESQVRRRIGPSSPEHGTTDGREFTEIVDWNEQQVIGMSRSYSSNGYQGNTAWVYDVASTTLGEIGLDGPEFRRADGIATSTITKVTEDGNLIGTTVLTRGENASYGTAAWLFNHSTGETRRHGLFGQDLWQANGSISNTIEGLNRAGYVWGTSAFTSGENATHGSAVWIFDPTTGQTKRMGLTGGEYRREDGFESSHVLLTGNGGFVIGTSTLGRPRSLPCSPPPPPGKINLCEAVQFSVAWIYDPNTGETTEIQAFTPPPAMTELTMWAMESIGEDGTVYGSCSVPRLPEEQIDYTKRACTWTREDGLVDLNDVVDTNVSGWEPIILQSIDTVTSEGWLVGTMRVGTNTYPYLLTPVPEPRPVELLAPLAIVFTLFAVLNRKR